MQKGKIKNELYINFDSVKIVVEHALKIYEISVLRSKTKFNKFIELFFSVILNIIIIFISFFAVTGIEVVYKPFYSLKPSDIENIVVVIGICAFIIASFDAIVKISNFIKEWNAINDLKNKDIESAFDDWIAEKAINNFDYLKFKHGCTTLEEKYAHFTAVYLGVYNDREILSISPLPVASQELKPSEDTLLGTGLMYVTITKLLVNRDKNQLLIEHNKKLHEKYLNLIKFISNKSPSFIKDLGKVDNGNERYSINNFAERLKVKAEDDEEYTSLIAELYDELELNDFINQVI